MKHSLLICFAVSIAFAGDIVTVDKNGKVTTRQETPAEEAARKAQSFEESTPTPPTPQQFPAGIESPVLVLQTVDGKGVGVVADGLDLVTYVDHASPRPDAATLAARIAAAKAERQALRDVLKDIRVETVTNIADCATISASTTNTGNAAQGVQIRKLADELADTNRQLNRLRRALLDYLRGTE
jgi:hypothetical protein